MIRYRSLVAFKSRLLFGSLFLLSSLVGSANGNCQAVKYADKFPGRDAGEKISACTAALPANGGICDGRNLTGEQHAGELRIGDESHAVQLLLGPVTLAVTQTVTVGSRSSIIGLPAGSSIGNFNSASVIRAADGSNLSAVVMLEGRLSVLQDLTIEGNRAKNPAHGAGLVIHGWRASLFRVSVQNAPGHGIVIESGDHNEACCAKLDNVMSIANGSTGLYVLKTGDVMVSMSEFENNGAYGIEAYCSSGMRVEQSDIGGNGKDGLFLHGTPELPSAFLILVGNQFGNNSRTDIEVEGGQKKYSSIGHLIAANEFIGSSTRPGGTFDAIHISNGAYNVITGNSFFANAGHAYSSCVSLSGIREKKDIVSSNYCHSEQVKGEAAFIGVPDTTFEANHGSTRRSTSGFLPLLFR